ncbi:MAG: PRC-barrel domain-containing protein [Coriobacteriia bacterium]
MRSLRELDHHYVYGEIRKRSGKRKRVGTVAEVLFHPTESRVVGFLVDRPDFLFVVRRKDRIVALDRTRILDDKIVVNGEDAWEKSAEKRLGIDWDKSVVWMGMPVRTESGRLLGYVRDGVFDEKDGHLNGIGLTQGTGADIALGVREMPASYVKGWNGETIVVLDSALAIETSGGAAAAAGRGVVVAGVAAAKTAQATKKAATTAAAYTKSAVKVAAKSKTAKKAGKLLKSVTKQVIDAAGPAEPKRKKLQ